jgi:hypothetical protein
MITKRIITNRRNSKMKRTKTIRKAIATAVVGLLTIGMTLNFSGCSKEMAPFAPEQTKEESISQNSGNQTNLEKIVTVNNGKVKLLNFTSNKISLKKLVTQSAWITPWYGGTLQLEFFEATASNWTDDYYSDTQTLKAKTTLKVLPGAVNNWVNISVTMDDELSMLGDIDMEFAPHGLNFNTPALLNIEAYNLDLSDINTDDLGTVLGLYYDNQETGEWEKMICEDIQINFAQGFIKVINAQLPHFSRYAVGGE